MTKEELKSLLNKQKEETLKSAKEHAVTLVKDGETGIEGKFKKLEEKLNKQAEETIEKFTLARKISLPGLEEEVKKKKFGWSKVVHMLLHKNNEWPEDSGFEKEILEQTEKQAGPKKRSTNAGTLAAGGALIPDEVTSEIIDLAI